MSDDAEFDAFLKGEDALSRRLQAMPQAAPSAALDAAILQRARDLMAQQPRPEAANDAGVPTPAPRLAGLGWRWRVPGAIAATILAGVFAHQAFLASGDTYNRADAPAPLEEPVLIVQPPAADAPAAPALEAMPAPPASMPMAAAPAAPAAAPAPLAQDRMVELSKPSPPPPPPPVSAAPAPMQEVHVAGKAMARTTAESAVPITVLERKQVEAGASRADKKYDEPLQRIDVTGSRSRAAVNEKSPDEWFAAIEAMLGKASNKDVLDEWRKFRKAYPYYPVPEASEERIKALDN